MKPYTENFITLVIKEMGEKMTSTANLSASIIVKSLNGHIMVKVEETNICNQVILTVVSTILPNNSAK